MQSNPQHTELGYSPDAQAQRQAELLAVLRQTAPEIISDNQIDIEKLKQLIGEERIAPEEHYELTWAGKAAARREIQKTSSHTLLPAANNPAQASHMLIEGENLEVLRVLQKSYYGKVNMIYIDPPYNTGNDSFVYPDDYSETLDEYLKRTGEKNDAGYLNKQSLWKKNSKESGQYHSAWLSMIYPRLYLARNLLRDDGVIFISIDDNEVANLKLLCDEIFGAECFLGQIIWEKMYTTKNDSADFSACHEYVLVYGKSFKSASIELLPRTAEMDARYLNPDEDVRGPWKSIPLYGKGERKNGRYCVVSPKTGKEHWPPKDSHWLYAEVDTLKLIEDDRIYFGRDGNSQPNIKRFLTEVQQGTKSKTLWRHSEVGSNDSAKRQIKDLFDNMVPFSFPKPTLLVERMLQLTTKGNGEVILDFFAGSGTTFQAVVDLNAKDDGSRQCISVQMPEILDAESEAYKAGYRNIADITRARIDKVIGKLKAEYPEKTVDLACAQFTLAPSTFKVWRGVVGDVAALRETLELFQTAEKAGSTANDVDTQIAILAELLLKQGLGVLGVHAISKSIRLAGVTVHRVLLNDDKQLWLCFEHYSAALKEEIVKARPAQLVLLNSCFVGDKADELLSNLQLELAGLDIALTVI